MRDLDEKMLEEFLKYVKSKCNDEEFHPYGYLVIMHSLERYHYITYENYEIFERVTNFVDKNFSVFVEGLQNGSEKVKIDCARVLGGFYDERSVEPLILAFKNNSDKVKNECIKSLARIPRVSLDFLIEALKSDDEQTRIGAIKSLIRFKKFGCDKYLKKIKNIRLQGHMVHDLDKKILNSGIEALTDENGVVRNKAIDLIFGCDIPNLVDLLCGLVCDSNVNVRAKVAYLLPKMYHFNDLYFFNENLYAEKYINNHIQINNALICCLSDKSVLVRKRITKTLKDWGFSFNIQKNINFNLNEIINEINNESNILKDLQTINKLKNLDLELDIIGIEFRVSNKIQDCRKIFDFSEEYKSKEFIKYFKNLLNDENIEIRRDAIAVAGKNFNSEMQNLFKEIFDNENKVVVKKELIKHISWRNSKSLFFKKILRDNHEEVWREAFYFFKDNCSRFVDADATYYIPKISIDEKNYELWVSFIKNNPNVLKSKDYYELIYRFLQETISNFLSDRNIDILLDNISLIENSFKEDNYLINKLNVWKSDAYFILKEYEKSYDFMKESSLNLYDLFLYGSLLDSQKDLIDANWIIHKWYYHLTNIGKKNSKKIKTYLKKILNQNGSKFKNELNSLLLNDYSKKYLTDEDLENLKQYFIEGNDFLYKKDQYIKIREKYYSHEKNSFLSIWGGESHILRVFIDVNLRFIDNNDFSYKFTVPYIIIEAFSNKCIELLKMAENKFMIDNNYHIDERWTSELKLFKKITDLFPDELVCRHGRPSWLQPQHLDIYFSSKNIAIEYQGIQHHEPVEYFGGEEGFKETQKRDKKKKRLCELNNCKLIYANPDYDIKDIENQIKDALE